MPMPPDPVAFTIRMFGFQREVFWYGIMITLGTLAGAYVADRAAKKRGLNPDHVWNALIVMMILGLLGARLYHVFSLPANVDPAVRKEYFDHPLSIINFLSSGLRGLGIYGAIAGGLLGLWLYTRFMHLSFPQWCDLAALGAPLGQAIGRWGNWFNQELYGTPTRLPWGTPISPENRLPQFQGLPPEVRFHPTFLYESLLNLLAFFILMYIADRWSDRLRKGDLALIYLILYPLGRYVVELQRPDAWTAGGVPVAQILGVAAVVVASIVILVRHGMQHRLAGAQA